MMFLKSTLITLALIYCSDFISAQPETISSSGTQLRGNQIKLDYSMGQVITGTLSGATVLTQGFLQGNLLTTTAWIDLNFNNELYVYPNPTTDFIHLEFTHPQTAQVILSNASLKKIKQFSIQTKKYVSMVGLVPGIYFLHVFVEEQPVYVIKIQKL